ncbi:MAG: AAA family ATPase [Anaerolineales bacterium]|nr:AAA family ATPase [Anaerolineales bacterium]
MNVLEEPRTVEATGVPEEFIANLALKIIYFNGTMKGWQVAQAMRLNFSGVIDPVLQELKLQHLVQVTGSKDLSRTSFQYAITEKGSQRARELLDRSRYVGPCPVTLKQYVQVVKLQAQNRPKVKQEQVRMALEGLVLSNEIIDRIGPAVNSFKSVFLYGPPGNGKTSIAKAITRKLLPDNIMVPHAIYEDGHVIKVHDAEVHPLMEDEASQLFEASGLDKRWVRCGSPVVISGGELTLQDLDLSWSETNRFYEAPLQLKANNGLLLIDDFGRQQMGPQELLNRWIVPLEERIDFLTFQTGKKFAIPFETLIVFSTNLNPESLVDEAFLRRIRHKMNIDNPNEQQYYRIFVGACRERGIKFDKKAFIYLLREYYFSAGRPLKACHPRDLLDQLLDFASYRGKQPLMSTELLDLAARSYFADLM